MLRRHAYPIPLAFLPTWLASLGDDAAVNLFVALQGWGGGAMFVRPTITELARQTHHSRSTIYHTLARLIRYGVLLERRRPNGQKEWHCLPARECDLEEEIGEAS